MSHNSINLQEFTAKLRSYRNTLEIMNKLTEVEIERISSVGFTLKEGEGMSGKEAEIFINRQMYSYLNKLEALVNTVPDFSEHGCFSSEEMLDIQAKALIKLKELGCEDIAEN